MYIIKKQVKKEMKWVILYSIIYTPDMVRDTLQAIQHDHKISITKGKRSSNISINTQTSVLGVI